MVLADGKRKILVIASDASVRASVQTILSKRAYTVAGASDAEGASYLLLDSPLWNGRGARPCPYDLILLDIQLDGGKGIEFLRTLRREFGMTAVPVLVVGAQVDPARIVEAKKHDIRGFIVKPLDPKTVEDRVAQCVGVLDVL